MQLNITANYCFYGLLYITLENVKRKKCVGKQICKTRLWNHNQDACKSKLILPKNTNQMSIHPTTKHTIALAPPFPDTNDKANRNSYPQKWQAQRVQNTTTTTFRTSFIHVAFSICWRDSFVRIVGKEAFVVRLAVVIQMMLWSVKSGGKLTKGVCKRWKPS